jgi:A/G-specific adenine glycosylase
MELGSLICTPRNPNCTGCPLRRSCAAYRLGLQSEIPPLPDAKIPTAVQEVAVLIRNGQSILLGRLPPDAPRWAGMWELPRDRREDDETDIQAARRIARQRTGVVIQPTGQVHALRHVVTRFRIELHIVEAQAKKQPIQFPATAYPELRWVTLRDIATYPIASTPMRKLIGELAEPAE